MSLINKKSKFYLNLSVGGAGIPMMSISNDLEHYSNRK